jgi:DegV family protein with EDD domain
MKFKAVYNALTDQGATEILSIHISKTLSAVLDMAQLAASETRSVSVTVLDSRQLSLGTGFLVETAACLAESGATLAEVLPILQEQIKRTHVFAALDTLHFLSRSGRMNSVISSIGELLQVKPILKMYDGVSSAERVRTRKGAIMRLIEFLHENGPFDKAALLHSDAMERASELLEVVRPLFPNGEVWLEQINPVLGAHIGPGVLGFALISKARI